MYRLKERRDPYWIGMPDGVELHVKPYDTLIKATAQAHATKYSQELMKSEAMIEAAGGTISGLKLPDLARIAGVAFAAQIEMTAIMAIIGWKGVGDEHGREAPVAEGRVKALMADPKMSEAFHLKYLAPLELAGAEGNGYGTGRDGDTATVPNTAADAGMPEPHAAPPASDALTI